MSLLLSGLVASGGALAEGWIELADGRVAGSGAGEPPRPPDERCEGILAAGLCDLQVNGAGGRDVSEGGSAIAAIDEIQIARGVTSYLPTLISPDEETALRLLPELAELAADPSSPVAGVHIEGPFLSPAYAGMHPPERLRVPADGVPEWIEAPPVRMVTLAPELPGALDLVGRLRARGIVASLGHSGADAATARAAIDAGATAVTHLFNAMAPLGHRAPGLAGVALADSRVRVAVIADGMHVDPLVLGLVRALAGRRTMLVTDAAPAAAAGAGRFEMAGVTIESAPGSGVRTLDGRLAGSALTLDEAVRNWAALTGAPLAEAIAAASEAPAAAIGLPAAPSPGAPADLVQLTAEGSVERVMRGGGWVAP